MVHRRRFQIGFTLIELLVVIAIISLLVSILLPALSTAKDIAKAVMCLAQERQIGSMMAMYAGDSNQQFPPWDMQATTLTTDADWPLGLSSHFESLSSTNNSGKDMFICPNKPFPRSASSWIYTDYGYNWRSVGSNYYATGNTRSTPARGEDLSFASETFVLIDTCLRGATDRGFPVADDFLNMSNSSGVIEARHGKSSALTANALYGDGHADRVSIGDSGDPYATGATDRDMDSNHWTRDGKAR